ncbi:hypothetical protein OC845_004205 [Tilletia horrida]|nr:hypothetical protein OC845_004205 [Tilletia horrida]
MVFNLIALFEIKSGHEEEMSQLLKKAAGIYKQDKHTIDWFIAQDAKEPTKFRVIERYTNQEEGIAVSI